MSDPRVREFFGAGDPSRVQYTDPAARSPEAQLETLGGGWYRLPDGSKVQGKAAAVDKLKADAAAT